MIDHRERQRQKIRDEHRAILSTGVSQEQFISGVHARRWPEGSRYYWALSVVCGPVGSAKEERIAAE